MFFLKGYLRELFDGLILIDTEVVLDVLSGSCGEPSDPLTDEIHIVLGLRAHLEVCADPGHDQSDELFISDHEEVINMQTDDAEYSSAMCWTSCHWIEEVVNGLRCDGVLPV